MLIPDESQNLVAVMSATIVATLGAKAGPQLLAGPVSVGHVDLGRQRNDHRGQVLWIGHQGHPLWQGGS
jgi:hypothetical protein